MRVRPVRWYSRQGMILTVWSALAETMKLESAVMVSWLVWNSCSNVCLSSNRSSLVVVTGTHKNTPVGGV